MFVLNLPPFEDKKYLAYDRFRGNGPDGEISTQSERSDLPCHIIRVTILRKSLQYILKIL